MTSFLEQIFKHFKKTDELNLVPNGTILYQPYKGTFPFRQLIGSYYIFFWKKSVYKNDLNISVKVSTLKDFLQLELYL